MIKHATLSMACWLFMCHKINRWKCVAALGADFVACWCDLCRPQFETRAECLLQHGDVINP